MAPVLHEVKKNQLMALSLMEKAAKRDKPDILVLPETWNTGFYAAPEILQEADKDGKETCSLMSAFAAAHHMAVVAGSAAVLSEGKLYNRTYVFDEKGRMVHQYDKMHGFTPMGEHEYFTGGTGISPFSLCGMTCVSIICYDLRFPELVRMAAKDGVDVLFVPAEWAEARQFHWKALLTARAIENQMYAIGVNGCGTSGDIRMGGCSAAFSPLGETLCEMGREEGILTCEIDLSVIAGIRESISVLRDRKPEYYHV